MWVVEAVASCSDADSVSFFFLRSYVADHVCVRYLAVGRYVMFADEEHCAGAFNSFFFWAGEADAVF